MRSESVPASWIVITEFGAIKQRFVPKIEGDMTNRPEVRIERRGTEYSASKTRL
jgi:hypothetical protein